MNLGENLTKYAVLAVLAGGLGIIVWRAAGVGSPGSSDSVAVAVPVLSDAASLGKASFDEVCAACHGANGAGTDKGPPLVHDIYNPGHHPDASFVRAVRVGTPQHHWRFGNMPPQPQVTEEQVPAIVRYVRELQQANGITWRPHRM